MTLEPGLERTDEFVAEGLLLTDVGGTLPVRFSRHRDWSG